jgi:hypothetical protein
MASNILICNGKKWILKSSMFFLILLIPIILNAQTPSNFSGKWILDNTKSKAGDGVSFDEETEEILNIYQGANTITIIKNTVQKGVSFVPATEKSTLDGKESIALYYSLPVKTKAKWSDDRKILTITTSRNVNSVEFITFNIYSLSDNGKTLKIQSIFRDQSGDRKMFLVYIKK